MTVLTQTFPKIRSQIVKRIADVLVLGDGKPLWGILGLQEPFSDVSIIRGVQDKGDIVGRGNHLMGVTPTADVEVGFGRLTRRRADGSPNICSRKTSTGGRGGWLMLPFLVMLTLACGGLEVVRHSPAQVQAVSASQNAPLSSFNQPEQIVAPTIDLDAPIIEMGWSVTSQWGDAVTEWDIPYSEAGWHSNSSGLGEGSNIVVSGHNNSSGGRVFANLESLAIGDRITLWSSSGEPYNYKVTERNIVRALWADAESEAYLQQSILPTESERLTLITCWPSWSNTHRLIIIAYPSY